MSNFKPYKLLCLAGLLALAVSSSFACAGPAAVYKPSGLPGLVAFASDRDKQVHIYTINPDGADVRSTAGDNSTIDGLPGWSPDGSRIVFSSNQSGNYQIWTMNADGSDRRKLTSLKGRSALPRWSPDGSRIVFTSEIMDAEGIYNLEIFVMNADGGDVRQLTDDQSQNERPAWNSVPTWSPDGAKILFASNRDVDNINPTLYIMNSDGSDQKKLGLIVTVDGSEPDWSPVTNKVVCVRGTAAKGDIWVLDPSSLFPMLTARKITENIDDNRNPVWSPDGTQIAFVTDANGNRDIYTMNADGTNIRRLTYGKSNNIKPAWR